jgi:hypothetical protein
MALRILIPSPCFPLKQYTQGDIERLFQTIQVYTGCWVENRQTQQCFWDILRATRLTQKRPALRFLQRADSRQVDQFNQQTQALLTAYVRKHCGKDRPCLVWGLSVRLGFVLGELATGKPATKVTFPITLPIPPPVFTFSARYEETPAQERRRFAQERKRYWAQVARWRKGLKGTRKGLQTWGHKTMKLYTPSELHARWCYEQ